MMTFNQNFERLLAAWRQHEEARESGSISKLAEARWNLDAARYATASSRPGWK